MALLDGGLQGMFGAAFAPQLLEGRHYKRVESRDTKGNVDAVVTKVQSFRGYRESLGRFRRPEHVDATAVLLILQVYEGRQLDAPQRGETALLDGTTWVLGDLVDEDAAHVAWRFAVTPA